MSGLRRDHYADPDAPAPETIITRVFVAVVDDAGRVLAHQRDSGPWSLPGGGLELGESIESCAARELEEETGARMEGFEVVTAVSDPSHVIVSREGIVHQQVAVLGAARYAGGLLRPSGESPVVDFLSRDQVDDMPFDRAQRGFLAAIARARPWVPGGVAVRT